MFKPLVPLLHGRQQYWWRFNCKHYLYSNFDWPSIGHVRSWILMTFAKANKRCVLQEVKEVPRTISFRRWHITCSLEVSDDLMCWGLFCIWSFCYQSGLATERNIYVTWVSTTFVWVARAIFQLSGLYYVLWCQIKKQYNCGVYNDLIHNYKLSLSHMLSDIFHSNS
jgi:hypothetical protein